MRKVPQTKHFVRTMADPDGAEFVLEHHGFRLMVNVCGVIDLSYPDYAGCMGFAEGELEEFIELLQFMQLMRVLASYVPNQASLTVDELLAATAHLDLEDD